MCSSDCFLGLVAILFPPLPVWVKRGVCSADSLINILLLILGYVPGLLHAWYIVAKYPEPELYYQSADAESGRIYVFVHDPRNAQQGGHARGPQPKPYQSQPQPHGAMNYGTTGAAAAAGQSSSSPAPAPPAPTHHHNGDNSGAGPSDGAPPPSYAQVVAGDHKIQSKD